MFMKAWLSFAAVSFLLAACSNEPKQAAIDPAQYQVKSAQVLQQRFDVLNTKLTEDFAKFKKIESNAFAHQYPFDANELQKLNMHLVASTSLKPTKIAYCDMMNAYFAEMYRLGHYNLDLLSAIQLPRAEKEDLKADFASADQFYNFILDRYTSYRQVQQTMNYGCNLKAAL